MSYGIITCRKCKRNRIIDLSSTSSKCPYCSVTDEHKGLKIIFEDNNQSVVRDALSQLYAFDMPEKKRPGIDHDPLSTLIYRYEKCSDLQERMIILSKGLTDIYDTFTIDDIDKVDPKNADKLLKSMLDQCLIYEVKYGRYRA